MWVWRSSRVKTIRAACDLVLCLLPFESGFLDKHAVSSVFVGHPLAEEIPEPPAQDAAREALGLGSEPLVALLPVAAMTTLAVWKKHLFNVGAPR